MIELKRKYWQVFIILVFLLIIQNENGYGQFPAIDYQGNLINDKNWRINSDYSDEFNYSSDSSEIIHIDTVKWIVDTGDASRNEEQLYRDNLNNIGVRNGYLNIQMLLNNPDPKHLFTSGECKTRNTLLKYGFIESSCKLPGGHGFWPAFWLWNCENQQYREIDIFEMFGDKFDSMQLTNTIYGDSADSDTLCTIEWLTYHLEKYKPNSFFETEHRYSLEWDPFTLIIYMDNSEIWRPTNHQQTHNLRLVLNLAFNKCVRQNCKIKPKDSCDMMCKPTPDCYDTNQFEKIMSVNYVRSFQKLMQCQDTVHFNDPNIFEWGTKKYIYVDPFVTVKENTTLRATEGIEIGCSFTVAIGTEFCAISNDICY